MSIKYTTFFKKTLSPKVGIQPFINFTFFLLLVFWFVLPFTGYAESLSEFFQINRDFVLFDKPLTLKLSFNFLGSILTIIWGVIFLFLNRKKLLSLHSKDSSFLNELLPNLYPTFLKKKPVVYLYKLIPILCVCVLVVSFFFLHNYHIGQYPFVNDEYQVMETAIGYLKTGEFKTWNTCTDQIGTPYSRAFPHTWMVAQSFRIFGISEWSGRILSLVFGCLLFLLSFFISKDFLNSSFFSLLVSFALFLHPDLAVLFKRTRMYAVLIPSFLLLYFFLHQTFISFAKADLRRLYKGPVLPYFVASLLLLYFNYLIHINSLVILPFCLLLSMLSSIVYRKWRFLVLFLIGIVMLVVSIFLFPHVSGYENIANHIGIFLQLNNRYLNDLVKMPFQFILGFSFTVLGFFLVFFTRKSRLNYHLLSLSILSFINLIFFVYVANRYYAFKYLSFMIPISVIYILLVFLILVRCFNSKIIKLILILAALSSYGQHFSDMDLNAKKESIPVDYRQAYGTIMKNFKKDGSEVLLGQFLRCYYMRDFIKQVEFMSLGSHRSLKYDKFISGISNYSSGWVTWMSAKRTHLDETVLRLIQTCFEKHHGIGKDSTNVEVYHFDQTMDCLQKTRRMPNYFLNIVSGKDDSENETEKGDKRNRIDIAKAYTVAFWVKTRERKPIPPISLGGTYRTTISIESRWNTQMAYYRLRYTAKGICNSLATKKINDGEWHHIVFYQTGGSIGDEYGIYMDGIPIGKCSLQINKRGNANFLVNNIRGLIQDIRVYEAALTPEQIETIYNKHKITLQGELSTDKGPFSPVWHWENEKLRAANDPPS